MEQVNHPAHYGGKNNPYEAIKVIEAWGLGFHLGCVVKYIARIGKKGAGLELQDLRKARWYLDRYIAQHEPDPAHTVKSDRNKMSALLGNPLLEKPLDVSSRDQSGR